MIVARTSVEVRRAGGVGDGGQAVGEPAGELPLVPVHRPPNGSPQVDVLRHELARHATSQPQLLQRQPSTTSRRTSRWRVRQASASPASSSSARRRGGRSRAAGTVRIRGSWTTMLRSTSAASTSTVSPRSRPQIPSTAASRKGPANTARRRSRVCSSSASRSWDQSSVAWRVCWRCSRRRPPVSRRNRSSSRAASSSAGGSKGGRRPARWPAGCRRGARRSPDRRGVAPARRLRPTRLEERHRAVGGHRRDGDHPFAGHVQRLAAGGEHAEVRAGAEQRFDQRADAVEQVLAVVEHEQQLLLAAVGQHPIQRRARVAVVAVEPERGGDRGRDPPLVGHRGEVDEVGTVGELGA